MAIINEKKERRLIPNWRDFSTTISLGELDASSIIPIVKPNLAIDDYIEDFRENETIPFAADLLSAAVVNGFTDNTDVKNAAQFIFDKKNQVTQSQFDISKDILTTKDDIFKCEIEKITINQLEQCLPKQKYRDKIKKDFVLSNGKEFLEIPYWEDDSDETWKKSIDSKIQSIILKQSA